MCCCCCRSAAWYLDRAWSFYKMLYQWQWRPRSFHVSTSCAFFIPCRKLVKTCTLEEFQFLQGTLKARGRKLPSARRAAARDIDIARRGGSSSSAPIWHRAAARSARSARSDSGRFLRGSPFVVSPVHLTAAGIRYPKTSPPSQTCTVLAIAAPPHSQSDLFRGNTLASLSAA